MAKKKDTGGGALGQQISAAVRAQLAPLTGLGEQITAAVGEAAGSLGSVGPLVQAAVREVTDVETLKAMADPTRLAILRVLMQEVRRGAPMPVMSAKELAEALDEPQTKLYRHLKVLEAAGLIEVAEQRIVSGIVETRYRALQTDLRGDTLGDDESAEQFLNVITAMLDGYRDEFIKLAHAGRVPYGPEAPEGYNRGGFMGNHRKLSFADAKEFHERMVALLEDMDAAPTDPDGIQITMLNCWYSVLPPDGKPATPPPGWEPTPPTAPKS